MNADQKENSPQTSTETVEGMEADVNENQNLKNNIVELENDDDVCMPRDDSGETTDTSSEKNESKDFEDEETFQCLDCKIADCMMWRKISDSNQSGLVCNLCHLKRVKGDSNSQSPTTSSSQSSTRVSQSIPAVKSKDNVRISKRKNKTNKKFANGVYGDKFIKNNNSKSRRNIHKKKPVKAPMGISSIVASQSIYHNVSDLLSLSSHGTIIRKKIPFVLLL